MMAKNHIERAAGFRGVTGFPAAASILCDKCRRAMIFMGHIENEVVYYCQICRAYKKIKEVQEKDV